MIAYKKRINWPKKREEKLPTQTKKPIRSIGWTHWKNHFYGLKSLKEWIQSEKR